MVGAAQREEMAEGAMFAATGTENAGGLRQISAGELQREAAERLAAHRSRRASEQAMKATLTDGVRQNANGPGPRNVVGRAGISRVRDAVAARYEHSVSYREFLAAEAERALQQAQAEAEVATRKAKAVAEAQMQLLQELEQWNQPEPGPREVALEEHRTEARGDLAHALADIVMGATELIREEADPAPVKAKARTRQLQRASTETQEDKATQEVLMSGLTVRLFEDLGPRLKPGDKRAGPTPAGEEELHELEQEIEFRRAPEFEPHVIETQPIPGNLIEFPRQLVASRKARPRLAEGPLREDGSAEPQLRIFEVEPEHLSTEPIATDFALAPEWQSRPLEAFQTAVHVAHHDPQQHLAMQPQTAPLELRLMAAAVDGSCIAGAFVCFAAVVAELAGTGMRALTLPLLGASAAGALLTFFVAYQMLFFTFAEATPGMRYARIGLCTFGDRNPSRKDMRRRVLAMLLAASPLGLGLAWAFMDDDRLGWHDRMSRMYQRAY